MKKITHYGLVLSAFLVCTQIWAQTQTVSSSIASWKNNAKGCYNIIHDDFGDYAVTGIQNYADTMNANRGLKFTFGAITKSCEQNPGVYSRANQMIQEHGHEIISHSHTHTCAVRTDWCTTKLWAETATQDFATELDYSTKSIKDNTGMTPRYFIFPYDQFNESANNHLKGLKYIGSRTGNYEKHDVENFRPDADGFFRSAVIVNAQTNNGVTKAINLNYWIDYAIQNNVWVNRELHNVGSSGWGHVTVAEYRTHLDYLKNKVATGDVWVGTVSEILTYQIQKINYTPTAQYNTSNQQIVVSWNQPNFNVSTYLAPLQVKSPITLNVDITKITNRTNLNISQNGKNITDYKITGNQLVTNLYPHEGDVIISNAGCSNVCITKNPTQKSAKLGENVTFSVSVQSNQNINYQWYFNGKIIPTATAATYTVSAVKLSDLGKYYVVVSNTLGTANSIQAELKLSEQVPYKGTPIVVQSSPTKIEAEDYDHGGQFLSYYDAKNGNEGNVYRTDDVDIFQGASNYYIEQVKDEWTTYSIDVQKEGLYRLDMQGIIINDSTRMVIHYMDKQLMDTITFAKKTTTIGNLSTKSFALAVSKGILKIMIAKGKASFDYFSLVYESSSTKADFSASKTNIAVNTSVIFKDASLGTINTYEWNFGEGATPQTATGKGPHTVTYSTIGAKTVSLLVNGEFSTIKKEYITVTTNTKMPCSFETDFVSTTSLAFADKGNPTNPFTHQMTAESWKITTNKIGVWDNFSFHFNDGQKAVMADFSASGNAPTITIRAKASSTVTLRTDMMDVKGNYTDKVNNGKNIVNLSTQYKVFTIDYSKEFYNYYGCNDLPCGVIDSSNMLGLAFFLNPGTGGFQGTIDIDYIQVGNGNCNLVADFTSNPNGICKNGSIIFEDASLGTANLYEWNFGVGASPATATGKGPHTVTYSSTGTKTVSLTLNGTKTVSKQLIVSTDLTLSLGDDQKICKDLTEVNLVAQTNGTVTWKTVGTGTFIGSGKTVTYLPSAQDKANGSVSIQAQTTANGCDVTVSDEVIITFDVCTNFNPTIDATIKLYPNPANENITIEIGKENTADVVIYNTLGNIIYHNSSIYEEVKVDVTEFVSGIYTVQIILNEQVQTVRFMKN